MFHCEWEREELEVERSQRHYVFDNCTIVNYAGVLMIDAIRHFTPSYIDILACRLMEAAGTLPVFC